MLQLPYYADSSTLPAPLPTLQDIAKARPSSRERSPTVIARRVNEHFFVKAGHQEEVLNDAENLLFIAKNTGLRVPRVYAVFIDGSTNPFPDGSMHKRPEKLEMAYVIMEYIHGQPLDEMWSSLGDEDKRSILSKLKLQIDEVRRIPSPGWIGFHDKRPLETCLAVPPTMNGLAPGPYETEADFAEGLVRRATLWRKCLPPFPFEVFSRALPAVFDGQPSVFTHSNIQPKNIMIVKGLQQNGEKETHEVILIDWTRGYWLPRWFEFASSMCTCDMARPQRDEWILMVRDWLEPHYKELAWFTLMVEDSISYPFEWRYEPQY